MKVPSSSSILLASLAVSSSSSAIIPPPPDTHQGAPFSSGSSALIASSSSGTLAPQQTSSSQRGLIQESIEQRGILDILPVACQLAHTLTDNLPTPVPALVALLCSPTPKDGKGSPNQAKAHKELSRISDTLQQAVFVFGASVPPSPAPTPAAASDGIAEDNGRVAAANSASLFPSSYGSSSSPLVSSASSTAWRAQPTPVNSPSLPVDDPQGL